MGSKTKLVFLTYLYYFNRGSSDGLCLWGGRRRGRLFKLGGDEVEKNIGFQGRGRQSTILSSFFIPFQICTFYIMIVLILASVIFDQLEIGIIDVIYNKMSIFQPFRMQIVSKSSRNHSNLYDSEWRISFLSDMRCVIRPQNYSIRKPMNFAIFLKRYFQRTRLKNISE